MDYPRRVKVMCPLPWSHHHGGWPFASSAIYHFLHDERGTPFYTNGVLGEVLCKPGRRPGAWAGILHATPDAETARHLRNSPAMGSCLGVYALSHYVRDFVAQAGALSERLVHPALPPKQFFSPEKFSGSPRPRLVLVGHWQRRFESLYSLDADPYRKAILRCTNLDHPPGVELIPYLAPDAYELLFQDNVIFLDLVDASANNTVVECIVRNTPVLVNRLPATEEYLGENYPLLYDNLDEASAMLRDREVVLAAHSHLAAMDKTPFTVEHFVESIARSKIYRRLGASPSFL